MELVRCCGMPTGRAGLEGLSTGCERRDRRACLSLVGQKVLAVFRKVNGGYGAQGLQQQIDQKVNFETFFAEAPLMHPNASKITGVICGYRVEEIQDKLIQQVRYLDKLVDELAKGKSMEKILRT